MNSQFEPHNVYYGNNNETPSLTHPTPISQNIDINTHSNKDTNINNLIKQKQKINDFLTSKPGSILATSIGMCIGLSFKDLAYSIITNIIQPIISIIISMLDRNNAFQLQELISNQHNALNFSNFSSSFLTFIFVIIISYYANKYLTIVV